MENEVLHNVLERLDRLEQSIKVINQQLSVLVDAIGTNETKKVEITTNGNLADLYSDKSDAYIAKITLEEIYRKLGTAHDFELRPIEELHESMKQHGIREEDNEFSRAIIAEREGNCF